MQLRMALNRKLDEELAEGPATLHNVLGASDGTAAASQRSGPCHTTCPVSALLQLENDLKVLPEHL